MRIAVFGGGSAGSRHAANARALGHAVDVYDPMPERGVPLSLFCSADAAMICTPAPTHEQVAIWLLDRGYRGPLFVEKPVHVRSSSLIFEVWPHPTTMVGYNWRFHPEYRLFPLMLTATGWSAHFDVRTDLRTWPGQDYGDPLLECSHEIDLALAWFGAPTSVLGGTLDGDAGAWIQMGHAGGTSVIDLRWRATPAGRRLLFRLPGWTRVSVRPSVSSAAPALRASYRGMLRHFLAAVREGRPTECAFAQGLRVVGICERVQKKETATAC